MIAAILSALGLGGLGVLTYFVGPTAMLGFGKSVIGMLAKIPWQVYAIAALVALLAFLAISRGNWIERAHSDETQLASICSATRTASGNAKMSCSVVIKQIDALGNSLQSAQEALDRSKAAVAAQEAQTAKWKQAANAGQIAAERPAAEEESTAKRLAASAQSADRQSAPCAPSKTLADAWN